MLGFKQRVRGHRAYLRPFQARWPVLSCFRGTSTGADPKINFCAIEQNWRTVWNSRGTRIQEEREMSSRDNPIVPLYMDHIRRSTIWALQVILNETTAPRNGKTSMVGHILSHYDLHYDTVQSDSKLEALQAYSHKYGADVVRTCVIFSHGMDNHSPIKEESILNTQKWFERIWEAVRVAHTLYEDNRCDNHVEFSSVDPEGRNDPDFTDKMVHNSISSTEAHVHIPLPRPGQFDESTGEDTCALWLASQEAILSMTHKVDYREAQVRLNSLIDSIIRYLGEEGPSRIDCSVHYHSTRILLSLLALTAPAFAEEGWLALHYGQIQWVNQENDEEINQEVYQEETSSNVDIYGDLIDKDLKEFGLQDLPRCNDPRTLSSIFAQTFPVPEPYDTIKWLRQRSTESFLRRSGSASE